MVQTLPEKKPQVSELMPSKNGARKQSKLKEPRAVDLPSCSSVFLVAKMSDGSRWKLPVKKLLESMADREQEYWEQEGRPINRAEAMAAAWLQLQQKAARKASLEDDFSFDGVNTWDDWKDLAERLPDERPDPEDMWADAEIVLCQHSTTRVAY